MRVARNAAGLTSQALLLLLAGCSDSGPGSSPTPTPAPPTPPPVDTTAPSVPQDLAATAQSSTQIGLSWSASTDAGTGVAGYRVFRDDGATAIATVTTTTYTDTNLTASSTYSYTVRAFDGATPANESAASAPDSATTDAVTAPPISGLDDRPSNATCLAGDAPVSSVSIAVQEVFPNLPDFTQPIAMLQEPGNPARWYVVEKTGSVRVFDNTPTVSTTREFINISTLLNSDPGSQNDERGLLGMAFHPDYPADPRVYLFYTGTETGLGLVDRVSEFRTLDGGSTLSLGSEMELLNVDDPAGNHNGGNIAFGPDEMLYIGIGDGGNANDQFGTIGNGQRLTVLLGKMLRIDVSTPATASVPYAIPPSNPYAANARCNVNGTGTANCPEIYAYGFRNPWRWSFDRLSGELWLNDVGQGSLEEVDRVVLGGNYGWRCFEGTTDTGMACGPNESLSIAPVAQYGRTLGQSTTGGVVYRGSAIPSLVGRYVFADFATGNIWHIGRDTPPTLTLTTSNMLDTSLLISSFAEDTAGELYVVNLSGTLHRIVSGGGGGGRTIATLLSDTGCVSDSDPRDPAAGLIPYAPNAPFFSDGAAKTRWLALPNGQRITIGANNDFDFPNGSVLMKNFALAGQLVETRLFMRHNDGNWAGYTYEWNAQETEATRVIGGKSATVAGQDWLFPSEDQCLQCHTQAAGRSLGLEIGTLNGDFGYPTGRTANQLVTLDHIDTLTPALAQPPAQLPVIPDPQGSAPLGQRARAYLHANCGYCHRPGGTTPTNLDLRYTTALNATNACDVAPNLGNLGITNPRLIAPGSAARSVVVARMDRTGADAMPPLARHVIDENGVDLISAWIDGLANCN
jgi:uncharacterized repeat protein (TIGR03806 family)